VPILQQQRLRHRAGFDYFSLQELGEGGSKDILAPVMLCSEFVDRRGDPRGIETLVGFRSGWCHNDVHDLTGYRTAPMLSLIILG
jgi:hypothetical protein